MRDDVLSLEVRNYRSIRALTVPLGPVTVIVGPNASGKTSLYRSLELLQVAARGGLARSIAAEGGMPSVLWAGERKDKGPVRMGVEVAMRDFCYGLTLGHPEPKERRNVGYGTVFKLDPEVKEEELYLRVRGRKTRIAHRQGNGAKVRNDAGRLELFPFRLRRNESLLPQVREPHRYPELSLATRIFLDWRFYHSFRTDAGSPLRSPQIGVRTPVLSADGSDLAAALQTIFESGDIVALEQAIAGAFPGAELAIACHFGRFEVQMRMPGMKRPFAAAELSDGTLRFLCLAAALLSPEPPALLALNEPETSLHPNLLGPLAELCAKAAESSQLWITTHSKVLAARLEELTGAAPTELELVEGRTQVVRKAAEEGE